MTDEHRQENAGEPQSAGSAEQEMKRPVTTETPGGYTPDYDVPKDLEEGKRVPPRMYEHGDVVRVDITRSERPRTSDEILWKIIRNRTEAISFSRYKYFMDAVFLGHAPQGQDPLTAKEREVATHLHQRAAHLRFRGTDAYDVLEKATEAFLMQECGFDFTSLPRGGIVGDEDSTDVEAGAHRIRESDVPELRREYLSELGGHLSALPYYKLVIDNLGLLPFKKDYEFPHSSYGVLPSIHCPCFVELIWNYWHEEAMLVQTMNAISLRFQNRNIVRDGNPLKQLTTHPLRPLSNFLWGYVQKEQFRLSVARRAMGYAEEYGLPLYGKAVNEFIPVDARSKFLEAFHNLLYVCTIFFRDDDNKMMVADAFNVLNALKEVHLVLSYGANNEFGDLVWTARQEMLIQQWLLAMPEFQLFLGQRPMVAYNEPWMGRVDTARSLMGWGDTSVTHYTDLANFGEKILLSVRYGAWSTITHPASAANWARAWRAEIQGYIHGYRAVTGVDLASDVTDVRLAEERYQPPAALLLKRLTAQGRMGITPPGVASAIARAPESFPSAAVKPRAALPSRTP